MTTWNAQDYSRNSSQQQKWANELIEKLRLTGDERLLDIGCGDGKVTASIARRLPRGHVVGIDQSEQMISFARMHHPVANLQFSRANATSLNFDAEFDNVFSNAVLHWIRDHRPALRGIFRALKPGGRALLQMGGHGNGVEVLAAVEEIVAKPRWRESFRDFQFPYGFYAPEEYRPWLIEAGLNPHRVELLPKDMAHDSIEAFTGWIRTTWTPWIHRVTEDRRGEFIEEVVTRYVGTNPPDEQGRVHVRMVRLEVEASKSN
jgi:trans-aconitate methyltransferase